MTYANLSEKKVLVTGASSGIGRETAILISKLGGNLILTGRDKERLDETLNLLEGSDHQSVVTDLTNEEAPVTNTFFSERLA